MTLKPEFKRLLWYGSVFLALFYLPVGQVRFDGAILEALHLAKWYAREHVLLCLVPAFFIAGAIAVFISQAAVMKYLGTGANKVLAYGVASVSGTLLAVCSCTVLPLFAGIYRMGAGLGPACAFLYSGPAINVLAIVLTAAVLGPQLGLARALGAIVFSVVIGLAMQLLFRREEQQRQQAAALPVEAMPRGLGQNALYFASMVAILVFANWGSPAEQQGLWYLIYSAKWWLTSGFALLLAVLLVRWFGVPARRMALVTVLVAGLALLFPQRPLLAFVAGTAGLVWLTASGRDETGELRSWFDNSWDFATKILPLLILGVLVAGVLLGRPGHEGLIPTAWVAGLVGGNSLSANLFAAVFGAFMYFATLTEIPILQGLLGAGMGQGPALALLLAGPALSLPSMLVIHSVLGTKKTLAFVSLVIVMATLSGLIYGSLTI